MASPAASVIPFATGDTAAVDIIDHAPHALAFLTTAGQPEFHTGFRAATGDSPIDSLIGSSGDMGLATTGVCNAVRSDDAAFAGATLTRPDDGSDPADKSPPHVVPVSDDPESDELDDNSLAGSFAEFVFDGFIFCFAFIYIRHFGRAGLRNQGRKRGC